MDVQINEQIDRSKMVKIILSNLSQMSDGELMDIMDIVGYETVLIRHDVFEVKNYHGG